MNSIKFPVEAYLNFWRLWSVRDAAGRRIANEIDELEAKQIALALNLHDQLVATLEQVKGSLVGEDYDMVVKILEKAKP